MAVSISSTSLVLVQEDQICSPHPSGAAPTTPQKLKAVSSPRRKISRSEARELGFRMQEDSCVTRRGGQQMVADWVLGALRTPWQEPVHGESRRLCRGSQARSLLAGEPLGGGVKASPAHPSAGVGGGAGASCSPPTRHRQLCSVSDSVLQRL